MADAAIVAALLALERRGMLRPSKVVDDAADPNSPLHSRFEWNDTIAGHRYRLQQARELITSIRVRDDGEETPLYSYPPLFIHQPELPPGKEGYVQTSRMLSDEDRARLAAVAELDRSIAILRRTRTVLEAIGMQIGLDRIIRQLEQKMAQLERVMEPA